MSAPDPVDFPTMNSGEACAGCGAANLGNLTDHMPDCEHAR